MVGDIERNQQARVFDLTLTVYSDKIMNEDDRADNHESGYGN
jgi:hypothetical protein